MEVIQERDELTMRELRLDEQGSQALQSARRSSLYTLSNRVLFVLVH